MLICYLDDSGTDEQNRITTVAGFIATEEQWKAFEAEVEPWFTEFGVRVLHATDLHHTKGEFTGWSVLRKQAFVSRLCQAVSHHLVLGVSMSAVKDTYKTRAEESERAGVRKRTVTPYTFCFQVIVDWILRDIRIGRAVHSEGIAFMVEQGNQHNSEAQEQFHVVRKLHNVGTVLRSISFVSKESSRAIQMADLLAFYSRRHGAAMEKAPIDERADVSPEMMMNLIAASVPIRSFVATDFGTNTAARPF